MNEFKGRLEMQEDLSRVSKQLRLDRIKRAREREQQISSERSELYRHFIEESKRQRLMEKKQKKAEELSKRMDALNDHWGYALADAGAAHRDAHLRMEEVNRQKLASQDQERRRKEAAEKRMAFALKKVREDEVNRKHKERETLILKHLRDQERWASREDAHCYGETRQVHAVQLEINDKLKRTAQSAESVYNRFPIHITPKITRHGVTASEMAVLNNAAQEELVARKTAWKNIMSEMTRKRVVKERATSARFKNFRNTSSKQLEDELKILHKYDKSGLRNWRVKEVLAVPPDEAEETDIKMNFEKVFMNVRPAKDNSSSPPPSRSVSYDEGGERSFVDDSPDRQPRGGDAFWIDFRAKPEQDAPWTPSVHSNASTDSATSGADGEDNDSDDEEPIRTLVPKIPQPTPLAWPGSAAPATASRPAAPKGQYVVETMYNPLTDAEGSSPDTSSLLDVDDAAAVFSPQDDHALQRHTSFKPFSQVPAVPAPPQPSSSTAPSTQRPPTASPGPALPAKPKEPIVFDDSELSNESHVDSSFSGDAKEVSHLSHESTNVSSQAASQLSPGDELDSGRLGAKRGQGQRLPSMSSLGASTQTSDLTKRSDLSTSDFEDVLVTPGKGQQQPQATNASYPSLSSSSSSMSPSSSSRSSSLSSPPSDRRPSRQPQRSSQPPLVDHSVALTASADQSIDSMASSTSSKLSDLHDALHTLDAIERHHQRQPMASSSSSSPSPSTSLSSAEVAQYQRYLASSESPEKKPPAVSPFRRAFPERFDRDDDKGPIAAPTSPWTTAARDVDQSQSPFAALPPSATKTSPHSLSSSSGDSETSVDYRAAAVDVQRSVRDEMVRTGADRFGMRDASSSSSSSSSSASSASASPARRDDATTAPSAAAPVVDGFAQTLTENIMKRISAYGADLADSDTDASDVYAPTSKRTPAMAGLDLSDAGSSVEGVRAASQTAADRPLVPTGAAPASRRTWAASSSDDDSDFGLSRAKPATLHAPATTAPALQYLRPSALTAQSTAADRPQAPAKDSAISPPPHPATVSSMGISSHKQLLTQKVGFGPATAATRATPATEAAVSAAAAPVVVEDSDSSAELDRYVAQLSLQLDTSSNVSQRLLQPSSSQRPAPKTLPPSATGSTSAAALAAALDSDGDGGDSDFDDDSISGGSSQHALRSASTDSHRQNTTIMTTSSMTRSGVDGSRLAALAAHDSGPSGLSGLSGLSELQSSTSASYRYPSTLQLDSSSSSSSGHPTPSTSFLTGDGDQPSYLYTHSHATLSEIQHEIVDMRRRLLHAVSYPQGAVEAQANFLRDPRGGGGGGGGATATDDDGGEPSQLSLNSADFDAFQPTKAGALAAGHSGLDDDDDDMSSDDSLLRFEAEIQRRKRQQQDELRRRQPTLPLPSPSVVSSIDNGSVSLADGAAKTSQEEDDFLLLAEQSLSSESTPRKYRVDAAVITSTASAAASTAAAAAAASAGLDSSDGGSDDSDTFLSMLQPEPQTTVGGHSSRRVTIADSHNTYHSPPSSAPSSAPTSMLLSEQSLSLSPRLLVDGGDSPTSLSQAPTPLVNVSSVSRSGATAVRTTARSLSADDVDTSYDHRLDDSSDLDLLAALAPATASTRDPLDETQSFTRRQLVALTSPDAAVRRQAARSQFSGSTLRSYSHAMASDYTSLLSTTAPSTAPSSSSSSASMLRPSSQQLPVTSVYREEDDADDDYDPLEHEQVLLSSRAAIAQRMSQVRATATASATTATTAATAATRSRHEHLRTTVIPQQFLDDVGSDADDDDDDDDAAFERDLQRTLQFIRGDRGSGRAAGRATTAAALGDDDEAEESSFDLLEEQSL